MSSCSAPGCKMSVPAALEAEKVCILHFTMEIERRCAEMRRESATGRTGRERQVEIINYVGGRGELLAPARRPARADRALTGPCAYHAARLSAPRRTGPALRRAQR